jgi:sigma-B regulation protein RsbU (phosphoserine phosphatase)
MARPDSNALYENAACGLLLTKPDGTILIVNTTFCNWSGYEKMELIDKRKLQDLLTVGSRIFHQTHWDPLLRMQGSIAEIKFDLKRHDGRPIPVLMNAISRNFDGEVLHEISVSVAEDRNKYEQEILKARRRAEDLLKSSEQMMGIVSHDLRNPLNIIMLGTQLLSRDSLTEAQHQLVERISRAGERAQALISDILDFTMARLGTGLKMTIKPTDVRKFISDSVDELSAAFPNRTLKGSCSTTDILQFDPDRFSQIIGNLVANADAYGSKDSPITIAAEVVESRLTISVHNFGQPIDPFLLPSLFMPMTRGVDDAGESRSVGLGLFIVHEIATAHRGHASVTSNSSDGTKFIVEIPVGAQ